MKASTLFLVSCLAAACSQRQTLTDPPPGDDAAVVGTLPSKTCTPSAVDAGTPAPVLAVWDGYMEQTFTATGHDQVHVVVRSSDTGQLSATAVFGVAAAPPPPPENSETCDPIDPVNTSATPSAGPLQLLEGFEYQLTGVAMSDIRLQFQLPTYQPLASWCACQVPFPDSPFCIPNAPSLQQPNSDGGSSCSIGPTVSNGQGSQTFTTSCCRLYRCLAFACQCDLKGCSYNDQIATRFDLSINGTRADGTALHLVRTQ